MAQHARKFQIEGANSQTVAQNLSTGRAVDERGAGLVLIEKMLDDEFRAHHVQPTDAQIKDSYDEHRDLFVKDPGEVQIAHIAVKIPPNQTDAQKKAAEEKIIKLYKQALKSERTSPRSQSKTPRIRNPRPRAESWATFGPGSCHRWWTRSGALWDAVGNVLANPPVECRLHLWVGDVARGEQLHRWPRWRRRLRCSCSTRKSDAVVKAVIEKIAEEHEGPIGESAGAG